MSTFQQLGLCPSLLDTLEKLGFNQPTPVQQYAIPHVLEGKDVLAGAQTGTGKTAAFGLPLIQTLLESDVKRDPQSNDVLALILVPTRELAQQVFDNLIEYASGTDLNIVTAYGGTSMNVQTRNLANGCDMLIATPGRLLDHLFCKNINLRKTGYLVFDEADRMLDMGFMPDIQRILKKISPERQTLFFSATFDKRIKNIAYKLLNEPVELQVTPTNSTAETVKQLVYPVDKKRKAELLAYLIGSRNWQQVLVFTKTKQGSDALAKELKLDGIKAASINGDKSQGARQKALDDFKDGKVRALIATDVAARGLDINQLEQVVNFDMPYKAEDYVHRIGRTGRAGKEGFAASLMSRDEEYLLEAIERLLDTRLPQEWLQGFEPSLIEDIEPECASSRKSRSSDKRKMKAKLKIHANRGKKR
ncbi:DEAD/DEAH box helicase [Vibrio japonicus]|uniref:DEAD/DEAH box helicase n=1 Tax=Vibrio japonicus TaxID=1824638 RepID=A0ABY5LKA0_9VIBR|nr:DEAD/DEAH box helicase [Vibrio japonicus]UUM32518.1 DEAD/DEAH box helicase [Vibrio japonicus]